MKYNLTLNENQLRVLRSALEVLTRTHSGQWDMVFDEVFRYTFSKKHPYNELYKKMDERIDNKKLYRLIRERKMWHKGTFYTLLYVLKKILLNLHPNEGFGICSKKVDNAMNTAFDALQVIRTELGDKRQPRRFDVKNELPKIEVVKKLPEVSFKD